MTLAPPTLALEAGLRLPPLGTLHIPRLLTNLPPHHEHKSRHKQKHRRRPKHRHNCSQFMSSP